MTCAYYYIIVYIIIVYAVAYNTRKVTRISNGRDNYLYSSLVKSFVCSSRRRKSFESIYIGFFVFFPFARQQKEINFSRYII